MNNNAEAKIMELQALCKDLGWEIALDDSADVITGLIIGNREYIEKIITGDFDVEDYDIYVPSDSGGGVH